MKAKSFQKTLLHWHARQGRHLLPWREDYTPYKVWLAEVMLQQTTVVTVLPYYKNFLNRWPTLPDLAQATDDMVMALWQGLGYYSRARNLRRCAEVVILQHHGVFPSDEESLRRLPGVGHYTAAAIRSIAYNQPAVVVDGNVERIIARLMRLPFPPKTKPNEVKKIAHTLADGVSMPRTYSEAMMDLGATICTPKSPQCLLCPVQEFCGAYHTQEVHLYPIKPPRRTRPAFTGQVYVVQDNVGRYCLEKRPDTGLLAHLYQFPTCGWHNNQLPEGLDITDAEYKGTLTHIFTHLQLTLEVYHLALTTPQPQWVPPSQLGQYALPELMKKALRIATRPTQL